MYDRFTELARRAMQLANREAQRFSHEYIGTEHILIGLIGEESGVAANVLKNLGVDLCKIRHEVEKLVQSGTNMITMGKMPHTPMAKKIIEYSMEESRNLNHNYVGTEHILLGLLREQDSIAAQALMNLGLDPEDVRQEVLSQLEVPMIAIEFPTKLSVDPPQFSVYCARPLTGCKYEEIVGYYNRVGSRLNSAGMRVLTPMCAKGCISDGSKVKGQGYKQPTSTNHAIKERDKWMVQNSNVIFVNLIGTTRVSIGSVMELAWADLLGVHAVVVLDEQNIHQHAFVLDCADIVFTTEEEALIYLEKLASGSL